MNSIQQEGRVRETSFKLAGPFCNGLSVIRSCRMHVEGFQNKSGTNNKSAGYSNDPAQHHFDGGSYCVQSFMQGSAPPQPLHFSNKVTESDQSLKSKDYEADLSGDSLDIIHRDRWQVF